MAGSQGFGINPLAIAAPDLYAKQIAIQRRQALGQALLQSGGGDAGNAAYGGLRNAGNALVGAFLLKNADKDMAGLYSPQMDTPSQTGDTGQVTNTARPIAQQVAGGLDPEGNPTSSWDMAQQAPVQPAAPSQPQMQAQPGGRTIPNALGGMVVTIPGMTKQASMNFFLMDPQGYYAKLAEAVAPTPEQKNYGSAYPGDPQAAQAGLQGLLTHNRTLNLRGGNFAFDPATQQGFGVPDSAGMAPVMGPNGQMGMQLVPGAQQALAGSNFASSLGKGATTPAIGYDANNMPVMSNQAQMSGNGGTAAAMIPGMGGGQPPLGIRSNNPGNLQPGGREAAYSTPTEGVLAAASNLDGYAARGINTVQGIVSTWAPAAGGNDPRAYADFVSKRLGVDPNQPLNLKNPQVKGRVLDAMFAFENGPKAMQAAGQGAPQQLRPELPAGQAQYMQGQAKDAADRHDAAVAAAAESPMRINVLDNIINLSSHGVQTGPGQDWQNAILGYAANTPLLSRVMGGAKDNVAKFQELQKFTYQNAIRNWQAAGGTGTDAQMQSMAHANPNDHLFPQALQEIARWGKAAELAVQGKANAQDRYLQQNGNTPSAQIQFESAWRNSFDPKVFQYSLMDAAQKQAFARSLGSPQAAKAFLGRQQQMRALGALP